MSLPPPLPENDPDTLPGGKDAHGGETAGEMTMEQEAATWAVRQHGGLDAHGHAELQDWLAADPRHATALDVMARTLQEVQQIAGEDASRLRAGLADREAPIRQARGSTPRRWRLSLRGVQVRHFLPHAAVALGAAFVVGAGGLHWWMQPTFVQAYASQRGQQIVATLPDDAVAGSTVQLDTATRIQARLYRDRREVELGDGGAMFSVHPDPARPFHVFAGDMRITVLGTRFSVRHAASGVDAGRTVVAVEEGHVRVESRTAPASPVDPSQASASPMVELSGGQMLEGPVLGDKETGIGTVTPVAPASVAQWRSGRVSFDRTPLAQALAEFERYGPTGLVVRDPAVARLPVSGSYGLRQHQRFAEFLPHLLPVRLVQRGSTTEIVAR